MRKRIVLCALFALVQITALAQVVQGPNLRSYQGIATNLSLARDVTAVGSLPTITNVVQLLMGSGVTGSSFIVRDTNGVARFFVTGRTLTIADTNSVRIRIDGANKQDTGTGLTGAMEFFDGAGALVAWLTTNQIVGGTNVIFTGNGAGLTNLLSATNFSGNTYYNSNVFNNYTNYFNEIVVTNNSWFNGKVIINNQLIASGLDITNILEKNVVVTTNTWGSAVVNFSLGTMVETNMGGNLTLTGIAGFVTSNLNWQTLSLNPNGADRVIVVPNEWLVSGFTNATTVTLPTTNWGILRVECVIGRRTNASLEIYYP